MLTVGAVARSGLRYSSRTRNMDLQHRMVNFNVSLDRANSARELVRQGVPSRRFSLRLCRTHGRFIMKLCPPEMPEISVLKSIF